ncbi:MAG TPA: helix-turn-helix domain-containing protein [Steroidobacteraceae bacterium]|nr:helix-turn-helix domain-containing protein [Steroidobacteraceae bacterium]
MFVSNFRTLAGDDPAIRAALVRFQRGEDRVPRGVRPVIEESWQRSLRGGVDPVLPRAVRSAEPGRSRTGRRQELLDASRTVMAQAKTALSGCGTMLILADTAGVVLRTDGDDNALADADGIGLSPGSTWSESARGTCGIGTSLYLGEPLLHIHGPEHYCREHQSWSCSASVVRDPVDDSLLGALSVGGPSGAFDPHWLPLVLATANGVCAALAEREELRRKRLLEYALAMLSRRSTTGLMLFDRRGRLVTADARARSALASLCATDDETLFTRVVALDDCAGPEAGAAQMPFWLRGQWLEAVIADDERIGTIVKFPGTLPAVPAMGSGLPRYKLRRVVAYIDARLGGPISLDDLANVAGVSRFHFHRQFRKSVGVTPREYVLRARIERAKGLLTESDLTVGEVSGAVGFADQSHFSNIFRRLTAMTPRSFRNSMSG